MISLYRSNPSTAPEDVTQTGTSPSLTLADNTASAKDLVVEVDGDKAQIREAAGAAGSLLALDLTNNRLGIKTNSPGSTLEVNGTSTLVDVVADDIDCDQVICDELFLDTIANNITAFAGGGQASATSLSSTVTIHRVTTVASAADSVKLTSASASGRVVVVRNDGANSMQVFGQSTETINGVASATGVAVGAGKTAIFVDYASGAWFMLLSA